MTTPTPPAPSPIPNVPVQPNTSTFNLLITGALVFVAGNAWNEAISAMIDAVIPQKGKTWLARIIYALLVTVVVILLVQILNDVIRKSDQLAYEQAMGQMQAKYDRRTSNDKNLAQSWNDSISVFPKHND